MLDAIWGEVRRQLRARLVAKDFDTWIASLRAIAWQGGELTLEVPSTFGLEWIRSHHWDALNRALEVATGEPARVKLVVNRSLEAQPPARRTVLRAEARPPRGAVADPRCTFETFVVGASNQVAFQAVRTVVETPGLRFNPLFVFGGTGLQDPPPDGNGTRRRAAADRGERGVPDSRNLRQRDDRGPQAPSDGALRQQFAASAP
jgi:chromosomal replication initiator protein